MEEGKRDNPEEKMPEEHEKHDKATDKIQYGKTSRKEPYKETGSDKTREQDLIQEEEVTNTELSWLKAKMNFENYKSRTSELDADISSEDFAIRIANQTELRRIMDTKLRQLEGERFKGKQNNNQCNTTKHTDQEQRNDRAKEQVPHQEKEVTDTELSWLKSRNRPKCRR